MGYKGKVTYSVFIEMGLQQIFGGKGGRAKSAPELLIGLTRHFRTSRRVKAAYLEESEEIQSRRKVGFHPCSGK